LGRIVEYLRTLPPEKLGLLDVLKKQATILKTESFTLSEKISKISGVLKIETLALLDSLFKAFKFVGSETLQFMDSILKISQIVKKEIIIFLYELGRISSYLRTFAETLSLQDLVKKIIVLVKAETFSLIEILWIGALLEQFLLEEVLLFMELSIKETVKSTKESLITSESFFIAGKADLFESLLLIETLLSSKIFTIFAFARILLGKKRTEILLQRLGVKTEKKRLEGRK